MIKEILRKLQPHPISISFDEEFATLQNLFFPSQYLNIFNLYFIPFCHEIIHGYHKVKSDSAKIRPTPNAYIIR